MRVRVINDEERILDYVNRDKKRKNANKKKKQHNLDLTTYDFNNAKNICDEMTERSRRVRTPYYKFT